jgi:transposase
MAKARSVVGLGVHATKIVAAVLDVETGELSWFSMSGDAAGAAGFCAGLPGPVRVAYEAGPTGYGLARELAKRGVECLVAGKLHPVRVPGPEEEALRDLVRAREQVRVDLMPPVTGFRSCCCVTGSGLMTAKRGPTVTGRGWATITLQWPAAQSTLLDCHGAIDAFCHRRDPLEREIVALLPASPWAVQVGRLRCLRGVDTLTAVGLCSEIGDFERFAKAEHLMNYIGLVPCEDTTGQQRRLGSITKTGSGHARRLLVEAAWHYRTRPRITKALTDRQDGQPPEAIAIAWSAQRRLHRTWTRLQARGRRRTIIAVAAARELAGFCWAICQIE